MSGAGQKRLLADIDRQVAVHQAKRMDKNGKLRRAAFRRDYNVVSIARTKLVLIVL